MGNRLAAVHERHRQTDRQTGQDRTDNGPITSQQAHVNGNRVGPA